MSEVSESVPEFSSAGLMGGLSFRVIRSAGGKSSSKTLAGRKASKGFLKIPILNWVLGEKSL